MRAVVVVVLLVVVSVGSGETQTEAWEETLNQLQDNAAAEMLKGLLDMVQDEVDQDDQRWQQCRQQLGGSEEEVAPCIKKYIKFSKVQKELSVSMKRNNLDAFLKKYCDRLPNVTACIEEPLERLKGCLQEGEVKGVDTGRRVLDQAVEFLCHNHGERMAMFLAEQGIECVQGHFGEIKKCVDEEIKKIDSLHNQLMQDGGLQQAVSDALATGPPATLHPDHFFTQDNCNMLDKMHRCINNSMEKCPDPTPSNLVDSLIRQMLKVTPCWQKSAGSALSSLLPHLITLIAASLTAAHLLL